MISRTDPAFSHEALPKTIKLCMICQEETPHQIRGGPGMAMIVCIACLDRASRYELERD